MHLGAAAAKQLTRMASTPPTSTSVKPADFGIVLEDGSIRYEGELYPVDDALFQKALEAWYKKERTGELNHRSAPNIEGYRKGFITGFMVGYSKETKRIRRRMLEIYDEDEDEETVDTISPVNKRLRSCSLHDAKESQIDKSPT